MRWINTARGDAFQREFLDFLIGEMLCARAHPGGDLYFITPWMQNIGLALDNRGYFADLLPAQDELDLVGALQGLGRLGVTCHLALRSPWRPGEESPREAETRTLVERLRQSGGERIKVKYFRDLHSKIYVGEFCAMTGSANATRMGLAGNKELLYFTTDSVEVSRLRQEARATFESSGEDRTLSLLEG